MFPDPDLAAQNHLQTLIDFGRQWLDGQFSDRRAASVRRVGVVGAGFMGRTIIRDALRAGLAVNLVDVSEAALTAAVRSIGREAPMQGSSAVPPGAPPPLLATTDLASLAACDLVVESISESLGAKRQLHQQLERILARGIVLGSNTSTIPIGRIGEGLSDPSRFCGIHFFPLREKSFLEVIRGPRTSAETVETAVAFARSLGKTTVVVDDGPGFLVNRVMMMYVAEANELLMAGAAMTAIDDAARAFGMALGPLELVDAVGVDTALDCAWSFCGAYPAIVPTSPLFVALVKARRLGRKSRAGFYCYPGDNEEDLAPQLDPAAEAMIARWAAPRQTFPAEMIVRRLFLTMVSEAVRILELGIVGDPHLVDLGVIRGLGFPESRGGLLYCADRMGPGAIAEELSQLQHLGRRFVPPPLLVSLVREGRRIYDLSSSR